MGGCTTMPSGSGAPGPAPPAPMVARFQVSQPEVIKWKLLGSLGPLTSLSSSYHIEQSSALFSCDHSAVWKGERKKEER